MRLIHFEIRMRHVNGPAYDWWAEGDQRVTPDKEAAALAFLESNEIYRNVWVEDDPHDQHPLSAIDSGITGLYVNCTVPGCTWSCDYD